jgi:Bacterial PH domain
MARAGARSIPSVTSVLRGLGCRCGVCSLTRASVVDLAGRPALTCEHHDVMAATSSQVRLRPTRGGLPAVLLLAICVVPLATARAWLLVLFVVPVLALLWILRAGVDVDPAGITVRAVLGRRRFAWEEVAGLRADRRGGLWLVLRTNRRLRLPTARARHLPLLAAASGGRIPALDPADGTAAAGGAPARAGAADVDAGGEPAAAGVDTEPAGTAEFDDAPAPGDVREQDGERAQ